ncbi:hypothetical protein SALBM311S_00883 [Streptomyces alboniger]
MHAARPLRAGQPRPDASGPAPEQGRGRSHTNRSNQPVNRPVKQTGYVQLAPNPSARYSSSSELVRSLANTEDMYRCPCAYRNSE